MPSFPAPPRHWSCPRCRRGQPEAHYFQDEGWIVVCGRCGYSPDDEGVWPTFETARIVWNALVQPAATRHQARP